LWLSASAEMTRRGSVHRPSIPRRPEHRRANAQKGRCTVPSRLSHGRALILAALLIALPTGSIAQRYGSRGYGGGWHGGYAGGYHRYGGYGGYRPYYGYGGYRSYYGGYGGYGGYYGYPVWGFLGAMLGAIIAAPRPVYVYPMPPPPAAVPPVQQCPDGSTVPMGYQCAAPSTAPAPAPTPQPGPERG
jgi:hypothetical protein